MTDKNKAEEETLPEEPELDDSELGIAGRTARSFINSPVTPLLMMAFLAIGLLGLFFTPRQEDPKISVPMLDIFVRYEGASAEQVTSLVTEPLERIMYEIPGVRHVYSGTRRGEALVTVRFKVGEDLEESVVKVHDKIMSNMDKMPPGVQQPLVKPVSVDDVPILTVTLWSPDVDDSALRTLANDVLQRLGAVKNAGKGFVVGGRAEQIRVEVLPERLSGFGIGMEQIANTIRTANAERKVGEVERGDAAYTVYSGGFLRTAEDVERLVLGVHAGAPIYVRDVARVFQGPEETRRMVQYYSGPAAGPDEPHGYAEPAVTVAIAKKIGTNGVTVANAMLERLDEMKGELIPDNVHVAITRNYGKTADNKVNELLEALFEAAIAVAILCLIGLGARAAFVVITVIPIVVLVTIFSAWILGYTVDRVSLFALVFAIGILVDDATVVVENIFRRWLAAGRTTVGIAIDAVREVGNPTILATLTIISALLPMGFVSGLMGPYMRPIPVLGSSAMFFSLLAAFIFTPWFAMRVRPQMRALEKAEKREAATARMIGRFYRPIMRPLIERRTFGLIFLFALVFLTFWACSLFYTKAVAVKMLPFDNKPEFNVVVNLPDGTALPVTANVTAQLADALRQVPEVTALQTYVGTASPFNFNGMVRHYYLRQESWQADIQVMLKDKHERERSSHEIAEDARHLLTPIARNLGARIQVVEMPPGPPVLQTVVAEVHGPDARTRRQFARDLTRMFEEVEGLVDVDNYLSDPHEVWRFDIDTEKAVRQGISVDQINRNLAMALGGYRLGDVKRGVVLEPTYIVQQVPLATRSDVNRLRNMPIVSSKGVAVPLAELGTFRRVPADPMIYHKDLRPVEYVTGEMEGRLGAPIYGMFGVEDLLEDYTAPDGVKVSGMPMGLIGPPKTDRVSGIEWTGEWTVTYETFRDMGLAFIAALLLIYGLIVWEFKNFALGGLIMAPIPLTLIGIIPGHWILGAEFTATSMIGFIALAGIIVRNSILLVEFVKNEVEDGKPIRQAVVAAGQTRMRPIFITALTLIAGAAAILSDPIFRGMAVSLFFGTLVATVLTLVVIPLGCISARRHFYALACVEVPPEDTPGVAPAPRRPLWLRIWSLLITLVTWTFYILRAVALLVMGLIGRLRKSAPPPAGPPPGPAAGPQGTGGGGGGGAPPAGSATAPAPPAADATAESAGRPGSEAGGAAAPSAASPGASAKPGGGATKKAPRKKKVTRKVAARKAANAGAAAARGPARKTAAKKRSAAPSAAAGGEGAAGSATTAESGARRGARGRRGIRLKGALPGAGGKEGGS